MLVQQLPFIQSAIRERGRLLSCATMSTSGGRHCRGQSTASTYWRNSLRTGDYCPTGRLDDLFSVELKICYRLIF